MFHNTTIYDMASFHEEDKEICLENMEESCSSLAVGNQLPSGEPIQTDEEPHLENGLESIDEEEPFCDGRRCDCIKFNINKLIEAGFKKQLEWIQCCLLDACSARLGTYEGTTFGQMSIYCVSLKNKTACPIVARNPEESAALKSELFRFLMVQLNLYPSKLHTALYPRIPPDWSIDTLFSVALLLGPVHPHQVDFDLSLVHQVPLPFVDCPLFSTKL